MRSQNLVIALLVSVCATHPSAGSDPESKPPSGETILPTVREPIVFQKIDFTIENPLLVETKLGGYFVTDFIFSTNTTPEFQDFPEWKMYA
ncbi:MAG: hypothetical protein O7G85_05715, partial [Planctomycetota bacterium]|nr:hypothetical protein [Planctomycetota bacterium]